MSQSVKRFVNYGYAKLFDVLSVSMLQISCANAASAKHIMFTSLTSSFQSFFIIILLSLTFKSITILLKSTLGSVPCLCKKRYKYRKSYEKKIGKLHFKSLDLFARTRKIFIFIIPKSGM